MASDSLSKMSLGKWIALAAVFAVVLVVFGFVLLTQFTSFQVPRTLIESKQTPQTGGGLKLGGSTSSRTNLDEVYDIIKKDKPSDPKSDTAKETGDAN